MHVKDQIIQRIKEEGPLSFHDFMEMALYRPETGYYSSGKDRIGANGDYYTSPVCSDLFGKLVAIQFEEIGNRMKGSPFTIVEYGAGNGALCKAICGHFEGKPLYARLDYCIVERNYALCGTADGHWPKKARRITGLAEPGSFRGCILSNELVDNFPVHRVCMHQELMEVFVDYNDGFRELLRPAAENLKAYLRKLQVELPAGYCTEINLAALDWLKEISLAMDEGYVFIFDYGYPSVVLYNSQRSRGNVVCYHRHHVNFDPYRHVGEQDITVQVNFSALAHWGRLNGLDVCGYTTQLNFLLSLGLASVLRRNEAGGNQVEDGQPEQFSFLRDFVLGLGRKIRLLVLRKGDLPDPLTGLQIAVPLE
jgi:SAM-dependent MidA family methyltransferase